MGSVFHRRCIKKLIFRKGKLGIFGLFSLKKISFFRFFHILSEIQKKRRNAYADKTKPATVE